MTPSLCLLLIFCLLLEYSLQQTCFDAVHNRITLGDISKYLPSYKNFGQSQKSYSCTPNTLCFQSHNQFYRYYGYLKNNLNCICVSGFRQQCTLDADEQDNRGIRSVFLAGEFYGNEEVTFREVVMVFLLKSRRIGKAQQIHQWYLGTAYPLQ